MHTDNNNMMNNSFSKIFYALFYTRKKEIIENAHKYATNLVKMFMFFFPVYFGYYVKKKNTRIIL